MRSSVVNVAVNYDVIGRQLVWYDGQQATSLAILSNYIE